MTNHPRQIRALLVEPEQTVSDWVLPLLENRGYAVEYCTEADAATERIRRNGYDLVLVHDDVEKWPGREIVKELVRVSPFSCSGVITDMGEDEVHDRMESLGIVGHVGTRPDPDALHSLLDGFERIWRSTVPAGGRSAG